MEPQLEIEGHDPNELAHFWFRDMTKQNLKKVIEQEVNNLDDVTPQTWKIATHNVVKRVKDSPQMTNLLRGIKSDVSSFKRQPDFEHHEITPQVHKSTSKLSASSGSQDWNSSDENFQLKHHQLGEDINPHKPSKIRLLAFQMLLKKQFPEAIPSDSWPIFLKNLHDSLFDSNTDIFSSCLKLHFKLVASASTDAVKGGFLGLINGLRSHYSRKYHRFLPTFETGIDILNPVQERIIRICHLLLLFSKELPKSWIKLGAKTIDELLSSFISLMTMHLDDSLHSKNIIFPFHVISALDPLSKWSYVFLSDGLGRKTLFSPHSRISTLLRFAVEEIHIYLTIAKSEDHPGSGPKKLTPITEETKYINSNTIKFAAFSHCVNILTNVSLYKKGHLLFPLSSEIQDNPINLPEIFKMMVHHINHQKITSSFPIASIICEAVINILKFQDCVLLNNSFISTVVDPIVQVLDQLPDPPNSILPKHTVRIIEALFESMPRVLFMLQTGTDAVEKSSTSITLPLGLGVENNVSVVMNYVVYLVDNQKEASDTSALLGRVCVNFFKHFHLFFLFEINELPVLENVLRVYQRSSSLVQDISSSPTSPSCTQSSDLLRALNQFLACIANIPLGLLALSEHENVIKNVVNLLFEPSVSWNEAPDFCRVVTLLTALPKAAIIIGSASRRSVTQVLANVWSALEDEDDLVQGLETNIREAIAIFLNTIHSMTLTFSGGKGLLSESEDSEGTLLETGPFPDSPSELLTFGNSCDLWHHVALMTLQVMVHNLDTSLYLLTNFHIEEELLRLQSDNVSSPFDAEPSEDKEDNENIIIDECSLLRNQILISTAIVGGPTERIYPAFDNDKNEVPVLFSDISKLRKHYSNHNSIQFTVNPELEIFLNAGREDGHHSKWLDNARNVFLSVRPEHLKSALVVDLLKQATNSPVSATSLNWSEACEAPVRDLFEEEILGIKAAVRYGMNLQILDDEVSSEEQLRELMQHAAVAISYDKNKEDFEGFDWFLSTVFLLCDGDTKRCHSFLDHFITLPTSLLLWPSLIESKGIQHFDLIFDTLVEAIVTMELPFMFNALKAAGIPWGLVCYTWIRQSFWNILDWNQIMQWLSLCILYPPDMPIYFCVALLKHVEPQIFKTDSKEVWNLIKATSFADFVIKDHISLIEKLMKDYSSCILPKLLTNITADKE